MQLFVALDFADEKTLLSCIEPWDPKWCGLKIGLEAFTRFGPSLVQALSARGFNIFLDLKFHDIPTTVARACAAAADLGVYMLNVHAKGGENMMAAAQKALEPLGEQKPYLIAVTVLTSDTTSTEAVISHAKAAHAVGLDGVVCSALEVPEIKSELGNNFLTITPGIRLFGDDANDQKRVVTPEKAKALGSDYAVIGRSITQSLSPTDTLQMIYQNVCTS